MVCAVSVACQVPVANSGPVIFSTLKDYKSDMDVTQRLHCPTSLREIEDVEGIYKYIPTVYGLNKHVLSTSTPLSVR